MIDLIRRTFSEGKVSALITMVFVASTKMIVLKNKRPPFLELLIYKRCWLSIKVRMDASRDHASMLSSARISFGKPYSSRLWLLLLGPFGSRGMLIFLQCKS